MSDGIPSKKVMAITSLIHELYRTSMELIIQLVTRDRREERFGSRFKWRFAEIANCNYSPGKDPLSRWATFMFDGKGCTDDIAFIKEHFWHWNFENSWKRCQSSFFLFALLWDDESERPKGRTTQRENFHLTRWKKEYQAQSSATSSPRAIPVRGRDVVACFWDFK